MKFEKLGLVIPTERLGLEWATKGLLTPTPILLNKNVIRVFAGFRDEKGTSRIGYVDVAAKDPSKILKVSQKPVLDTGRDGCFDDSGVILGDVVKIKNKFHMYYVGFQLPQKAKFLAFTGLATSKDLKNFKRNQESPIIDRAPTALYINALHSIVKNKNTYVAFVACGSGWEKIGGGFFPRYEIYSVTSKDGFKFKNDFKLIIPNNKKNKEYRIGRPSAFFHQNRMHMFFTKGSTSGLDYKAGYASASADLKKWARDDSRLEIELGPDAFDNKHLCYPRFIQTAFGAYIFYNGNNMGLEGIAAARVVNGD